MRPIIIEPPPPTAPQRRQPNTTSKKVTGGCSMLHLLIVGIAVMSCCLVAMTYAFFTAKSGRHHHHHHHAIHGAVAEGDESLPLEEGRLSPALSGPNITVNQSAAVNSRRATLPISSSNSSNASFVQVRSMAELKKSFFYRMQEVKSKFWLARTVDTNADASLDNEKIVLFNYVKHYDAWSIQGHTRMHLTCELNDRVTVDRKWARSFEMWLPSFTPDGHLILKSKRNKMFLRPSGAQNDQLMADISASDEAARWVLLREPSPQCNREEKDADVPKKDLLERLRGSCWGPEGHVKALPQALSSTAKFANATVPVFGSPKPLSQLSPKDAKDKYDTFIISNRTLHNWAMIDGVEPFLLADDSGNQELVKRVNSGSGIAHKIALQTSGFELHKDPSYEQPTYRGLFDAALRRFPTALAVMYSNSDILYTPSLVETVRSVASYVDRERERMKRRGLPYNVRGWMIVGQRVNHDIPPNWNLDASGRWVDTVEGEFAKQGDLFESDAEDYFIVSRGLFDWMKDIPDFVVGGVAFDNWITNKVNVMASRGEAIEVDGSKTIIAVHQNHGGDPKKSHEHPKSIYNSHLAARNGGWTLGHTADALYATERRAADGAVTVYDKHRLLYP
ncbi:membrane-associated protein, putative [Bodo saltans]|uniref:Membrane-associated protein, putative n=1 Tax=Bodo saltans TaxID=75058 RepID=A0A0S4IWD7_BODSA|nr:membrane-associated protein, putative [Bodo saltans]|eukprot:CUG28314.1 membrane-associated protein, putative [Bodo saltans]